MGVCVYLLGKVIWKFISEEWRILDGAAGRKLTIVCLRQIQSVINGLVHFATKNGETCVIFGLFYDGSIVLLIITEPCVYNIYLSYTPSNIWRRYPTKHVLFCAFRRLNWRYRYHPKLKASIYIVERHSDNIFRTISTYEIEYVWRKSTAYKRKFQ